MSQPNRQSTDTNGNLLCARKDVVPFQAVVRRHEGIGLDPASHARLYRDKLFQLTGPALEGIVAAQPFAVLGAANAPFQAAMAAARAEAARARLGPTRALTSQPTACSRVSRTSGGTMNSTTRHILGATVCAFLAVGPVGAQQDPGTVKLRNDCRLGEQVLTHGRPANKRDWALQLIGSCPQGARVVASMWNAPPRDDSGLQGLYHASIHAKDPALFSRALSIAQDGAVDAPVRLAALGTVVTYLRPDLILNLVDRTRQEGWPPIEWSNVWANLDHPMHRPGEVSLPAGAMEAATALVQILKDGDGIDPLLRDSAYWLTAFYQFGN